MENIRQYDQFMLELERRLRKEPANHSRILLEAILTVQCPYIKEKIKEKCNQKI